MSSFAHVIEIENPFEPWDTMRRQLVLPGQTIRHWLDDTYGAEHEFEFPTICYYRGEPLLRKDWDTTVIKPGDIIQFFKVIGDPITIIIAVVVAAAVVALVVTLALVNTPQVPGGQPEPDPVYTLRGQNNRIRLSEPIEIGYGRIRMWPSYAARPYNVFEGNDQFQYNLYCLGQGYYDVEEIRIDDTPIDNFKEVSYEVIEPYGEMSMFPDNVITSAEVAGIELFGWNQAEYDGWTGPFVVNPAYTKTNQIDIDLLYPTGLYRTNDEGRVLTVSVSYRFEARAIDDTGTPLGDWIPLVQYEHQTIYPNFTSKDDYRNYMLKVYFGVIVPPVELVSVAVYTDTRAAVTPQRLTRSFTVPNGRYEVRGRREGDASTNIRYQDTLIWQGLRAFLPSTKEYGGVTMLAMRIRATNNINDQSRSRVNVIATRKLATWDAENNRFTDEGMDPGEGLVATRNPVDAFLDVFRAEYGGKLTNQFFDFDTLMSLRATFAARGDNFDWIFDQQTTLMEAATAIARVGRSIPMMLGSRISMVRDEAKSFPVAMFTPECMVKDSFRNEVKLFEFDGYDSVIMQYVDPETWQEEEVTCALADATTDNPLVIKLPGCTSRAQAYREGMFIAANMRYTRENITFATGLEGNIPAYGDLIAVGHDVLDFGQQFGIVLGIQEQQDPVRTVFILSEPVAFEDGSTSVIALRSKDGSILGPYAVVAGDAPTRVVSVNDLTAEDLDAKIYFDADHERPVYLFGVQNQVYRDCKVVNLTPNADDTVEVTCVPYYSVLHTFDNLAVPPVGEVVLPPAIPDLPTMDAITISVDPLNPQILLASWTPAYGARYYVVELSGDGENYDTISTVTAPLARIVTPFTNIWLRISAVNKGAGEPVLWSGFLTEEGIFTSTLPLNLRLSSVWDASSISILWDTDNSADTYKVKVYTSDGGTLIRETDVGFTGEYTYTLTMAIADGFVQPTYHLEVTGIRGDVESVPAKIDVTNAAPQVPDNLNAINHVPYPDKYWLTWTWYAHPDILNHKVYVSDTTGFTPDESNLFWSGSTWEYQPYYDTGGVTPKYWRVAATDVWGNVSMSAEATIPA